MNDPITYLNDHYYLNIGLLTMLAFSFGVCFLLYIQLAETKVAKQTCTSFATYQQALEAYNVGNTGLDHNKNGYPCEHLI